MWGFLTLCLNGASVLQETIELALLRLQIGVSTDVLLLDEDVRNAALTGDVLEGVLESCAVVNLIQLHQEVLCALLVQQSLGGFAVWAVGLGEDHDGVVVDNLLRLVLCGHDGVGTEGASGGAAEEAAK